uniref:Uncharacterized protein n=1 Tax=Arundo donax TaxID=35708 RepID=A0A0A8YBN9_ARUDO
MKHMLFYHCPSVLFTINSSMLIIFFLLFYALMPVQ